MVAAPQGHAVELHPQARAREARGQQIVALQPARRPVRQRTLAGQPRRLPGDRIRGRRLNWRQQPLVRLRQPCRDGLAGGVPLGLGLLHLVGRQVERLALGENRFPGEVTPDGLVEVLQPGLVRGEEDEGVAVEPRRGPPQLEDGRGRGLRRRSGLAPVRVRGVQHHQARLPLVRNVVAGLRCDVNAAEAARLAQRGAQPLPYRLGHAVRLAAQLLGAVLGQLRDGRPRVVPVAGAVLVQVGGGGSQPPQGVSEDRGPFAGEDAAELDAPVLEPALRRARRRRRPEVDGARDAAAGRVLAEVRHFAVDSQRQRLRAVDVPVDDRPPVVGQIAGQLGFTSVPHFQDHASDNWEPEGAGSDGVVNRSWSGRRSNMLSWSTCSIW